MRNGRPCCLDLSSRRVLRSQGWSCARLLWLRPFLHKRPDGQILWLSPQVGYDLGIKKAMIHQEDVNAVQKYLTV
jgi:hypothetical protein